MNSSQNSQKNSSVKKKRTYEEAFGPDSDDELPGKRYRIEETAPELHLLDAIFGEPREKKQKAEKKKRMKRNWLTMKEKETIIHFRHGPDGNVQRRVMPTRRIAQRLNLKFWTVEGVLRRYRLYGCRLTPPPRPRKPCWMLKATLSSEQPSLGRKF